MMSFLPIVSRTAGAVVISLVALGACTPTVKIEVPDKPIHLKVDLNINHEIRLKVEKDLEQTASVEPRIPLFKKGGWIGEKNDGYLGVVDESASEEIREAVLEANEVRYERYVEIAEENELTREEVETLAGRALRRKSARGDWIQTEQDDWVRQE